MCSDVFQPEENSVCPDFCVRSPSVCDTEALVDLSASVSSLVASSLDHQ